MSSSELTGSLSCSDPFHPAQIKHTRGFFGWLRWCCLWGWAVWKAAVPFPIQFPLCSLLDPVTRPLTPPMFIYSGISTGPCRFSMAWASLALLFSFLVLYLHGQRGFHPLILSPGSDREAGVENFLSPSNSHLCRSGKLFVTPQFSPVRCHM